MAGEEAPQPDISPPAPATEDGALQEPFQCCVCLDLLHKPIVLACGHISCFWCVHKAMHGLRTSNCPICRQPYNHFPSICQLLHNLLLKMEPVAYKRREHEVLEEERRLKIFSPQFGDSVLPGSVPSEDNSGALEELETSANNLKPSGSVGGEESLLPENGVGYGICRQVSVNDVLCGLCGKLLFKPAVLNCGHVYCESCLVGLGDAPLKCPDCESSHPGGFPNVCLDLEHFLEEQFPEEYAERKAEVQLQRVQALPGDSSSSVLHEKKGSKQSDSIDDYMLIEDDLRNIHVGVGCDSCGMYPLRGKRYKCKDCTEAIGFDLCEACYNTTSKLPGRFNQQHTPDHKFELDESQMLCRILLRSLPVDSQELAEDFLFEPLSDDQEDPDHNNGVQ
ncbi:E3 ubiquitin-protein ligase PRT1-like isoform X1 [Iris pallida]|uniref:E3 ubiquitin-protein ligase PRT1-like isoform X1 n=1 Tax=Iris pallida TaxID=29817 RepID=A0AAX6G7I9_IRIPA|nr:E3 ubiquitin-protein ligase PRT1-like isoform X1 [Iris pallida]